MQSAFPFDTQPCFFVPVYYGSIVLTPCRHGAVTAGRENHERGTAPITLEDHLNLFDKTFFKFFVQIAQIRKKEKRAGNFVNPSWLG